jgi:hypothetical protein
MTGGLVIFALGWALGVMLKRESTGPRNRGFFEEKVTFYANQTGSVPPSDAVEWNQDREVFVLRLGAESVDLPRSPYGGQMGYRSTSPHHYELWVLTPTGPVLAFAGDPFLMNRR